VPRRLELGKPHELTPKELNRPCNFGVLKMQSVTVLQELIDRLPARLQALPSEKVEHKPAPDAWSAKEELGHLLDSAANNHQRIVRTQLEEHPAMPGYDGDAWVALHQYHSRDWHSLIERWAALNRQLLAAAEAAPDSAWSRTCTIGDSKPLTLQFVFDDYIHHMLEHLRHMGVQVDDLAMQASNAG
jgi:DinB family protein